MSAKCPICECECILGMGLLALLYRLRISIRICYSAVCEVRFTCPHDQYHHDDDQLSCSQLGCLIVPLHSILIYTHTHTHTHTNIFGCVWLCIYICCLYVLTFQGVHSLSLSFTHLLPHSPTCLPTPSLIHPPVPSFNPSLTHSLTH